MIILMGLAQIETVIGVVATSVAILSTIITLIIRLVKAKKEGRAEAIMNFFNHAAQEVVILAEEFKNFEGKDKKEWAMTRLNQMAIEAGIKWDATLASSIIEEVVRITKSVNQRDKDRNQEELE